MTPDKAPPAPFVFAADGGGVAGFLRAWSAWRGDAQSPHVRHAVATAAGALDAAAVLRSAQGDAALHALAAALAAQCADLEAGWHRLWLDRGRLLLTLLVGDAARQLPAWQVPQQQQQQQHQAAGTALVVGAGLAGAATAASLARRGWQVTVLEAGPHAAAGASGLPAGLFAPHVSKDDKPLSQITRAGLRALLPQARALLAQGSDWAETGVVERVLDGAVPLPPEGRAFSRHADVLQPAMQHAPAGWLKPAALVRAWLAQPGIALQTGCAVSALQLAGGQWQALDAHGRVLHTADRAVVCCGWASGALLAAAAGVPAWPLQALRGQLARGPASAATDAASPCPVNGHGHWLSGVPLDGGRQWLAGSTFERGQGTAEPSASERAAGLAANRERLGTLLPAAADAAWAGPVGTWWGVRGASPDRLPAVGAVLPEALPGLHTVGALGARGITLAALCGELLAAQWMDEPPPLAPELAHRLRAERLQRWL